MDRTGGDLFIVDNSVSGRTVAEYLRQWSDRARAFDIATGFFEIGALLALDGRWQQLERIRILMGDEVSLRTLDAFKKALADRQQRLDDSLEGEKRKNPFLDGVTAVTERLAGGKIECRVYRRKKFHAKAYITRDAKHPVIGPTALVGSSNFTKPGLTQNVELNIQVQSGREVAELQDWFEKHWEEAEDVTADVLRTITRHTAEFSPFDVYAKALHEFFRGRELTAGEWDRSASCMFDELDRYQQEAYWSLMKIARRHGGAFLCDGVGLGKTFVGLMLIERLILHENKRVVLFAPKAAREGVWEPHLRRWLPHIGGVGGSADFSSLSVFSHTDLGRKGDFPDRFERVADLADAVIIDEAHHFRNRGTRGDRNAARNGRDNVPIRDDGSRGRRDGRDNVRSRDGRPGDGGWGDNGSGGDGTAADGVDEKDRRSRYWRLFDLLDGSTRPKLVFLLTATPVNNRLADFRHMVELFTRGDESFFARSLGVNHLSNHLNRLEHDLRATLASDDAAGNESGSGVRGATGGTGGADESGTAGDESDAGSADDSAVGGSTAATAAEAAGAADSVFSEGLTVEAREALAADVVFDQLVVQRSRSYAKESQKQERGESTAFPERKPPQVADYSIRPAYRRVLDMFEQACAADQPLFTLAMYYPLAYYIGDEDINPFEEGRQKQVVGLIRTLFLKRFESSSYAFEKSLDLLLRKLLAFVKAHSTPGAEQERLEAWLERHAAVVTHRPEVQLELNFDTAAGAAAEAEAQDDEDAEEDVIPPELLEAVTHLSREEYDVPRILDTIFADLDQMARFLDATRRLAPGDDDKARKLIRLLRTKDLATRKVLLFTEFADTARYVEAQLREAGIEGVARIDGGSTVNRAEVIRRFSPYYNGSTSEKVRRDGDGEIRVLVSTDVLSEGLNLQDATRLINYDLHWNPVRLMQRIGRVDRRMSPDIEKRLLADHPDAASDRGIVRFWNFLPPEELDRILKLYKKVSNKTLLISRTLGIEGRKLLRPDDEFDPLREFNAGYEGKRSAVEEMHLEYQRLLKRHPDLAERLDGFPGSVFSGRRKLKAGARGVFFCYALPALDPGQQKFTLAAGPTRWYLYDLDSDIILETPGEIANSIRSNPKTPRRCTTSRATLLEIRAKILRHVTNTYLKRLNAPLNAPDPHLHCWMELN